MYLNKREGSRGPKAEVAKNCDGALGLGFRGSGLRGLGFRVQASSAVLFLLGHWATGEV